MRKDEHAARSPRARPEAWFFWPRTITARPGVMRARASPARCIVPCLACTLGTASGTARPGKGPLYIQEKTLIPIYCIVCLHVLQSAATRSLSRPFSSPLQSRPRGAAPLLLPAVAATPLLLPISWMPPPPPPARPQRENRDTHLRRYFPFAVSVAAAPHLLPRSTTVGAPRTRPAGLLLQRRRGHGHGSLDGMGLGPARHRTSARPWP